MTSPPPSTGLALATLCSGIGAPEVAAKRLGWRCLWSAEIEPFPSAVLAHHHPESGNLGDITKIDGRELERPDVLVFGTPCQSFSVAGKRAGMDDPRGVLAFVALGIVGRVRPAWFILENVPGLLSSSQGRDFGAFLRAVDGIGYSGAWASPDAQFFGVPQRRERVFFVGHIGDWRYPAAVLSQFSRLCGHPSPGREKGERVAPTIASRPSGGGGLGTDFDCDGGLISLVAGCLSPGAHPGGFNGQDAYDGKLIAFSCKDHGADTGEVSPPLRAMGHDVSHANAGGQVAVAFHSRQTPIHSDVMLPLEAGGGQAVAQPLRGNIYNNSDSLMEAQMHVRQGMSVRRLTPRECERLQGFPDDYTLISYRGKPAADGPRYKALGNSMAVPVLGWLLRKIEEVNG